jgi:hypothetical protein
MRASIRTSLLAVLLLAGCATSAPPEPRSMRDPDADFTTYRTFGWAPTPSPAGTDAPLQLLDKNIREAIAAEMKRKGYEPAPDQTTPDLLIAYETERAEKLKNNPFRIGVGVGSWGGNTGGSVGMSTSGVKEVSEGTLVVHVIDPARKAEVYQGRASRELGKGNADPAVIQGAVADVFRDFPARGGQP